MKYLLLCICCPGLFLLSCDRSGRGSNQLVTVDSVLESGFRITFQRERENGLREGLFQMYDDQGVLYEQSTYRQGKLHGPRMLFFPSGDTLSVETLVNGRHEGPYRLYHESGKLELEGRYADNAMNGIWKRYYPNGQLRERVSFRDNREEGPFVEYHPNGALKAEGAYTGGDNEQGELKLYDEEGELVRIMDCERGICRTRWKAGENQAE